MLDLDTLIRITSDTLTGGNVGIAGTLILIGILAVLMAVTRKTQITLVLAVPLIMIWAVMGYLPSEIGIMMLVIVALIIAISSRGAFE